MLITWTKWIVTHEIEHRTQLCCQDTQPLLLRSHELTDTCLRSSSSQRFGRITKIDFLVKGVCFEHRPSGLSSWQGLTPNALWSSKLKPLCSKILSILEWPKAGLNSALMPYAICNWVSVSGVQMSERYALQAEVEAALLNKTYQVLEHGCDLTTLAFIEESPEKPYPVNHVSCTFAWVQSWHLISVSKVEITMAFSLESSFIVYPEETRQSVQLLINKTWQSERRLT